MWNPFASSGLPLQGGITYNENHPSLGFLGHIGDIAGNIGRSVLGGFVDRARHGDMPQSTPPTLITQASPWDTRPLHLTQPVDLEPMPPATPFGRFPRGGFGRPPMTSTRPPFAQLQADYRRGVDEDLAELDRKAREGRLRTMGNVWNPNQSNPLWQNNTSGGKLFNDVVSSGAQLGHDVWNGVNSFISPGAHASEPTRPTRKSEQQLREFNADVERKRREEELVRQNAKIYQMMNDYSEYQNAQQRARQRNVEARQQQQRQQAQQRIIEPQVRENTHTPPQNPVPDIIHMPALQHALEKRRVKRVNTRPLDENANLHYTYSFDNRTQYHPPAAALDPTVALYHYMYGNGRPLTVQMKDIRLDNLANHQDMPDFKVIAKALRHDNETELELAPRSISLPVSNLPDKASLGTVTIQLTGTVRLASPRHWVFQGTITSPKGDIYDFNKSSHRSPVSEWSTWVGSQIPGKNYRIIIEGEQPIEISGYY